MPFLSRQKSIKRKFRVSQAFSVSGVQTPKVHGPNHTSSWLGGVFPPEVFSFSSSFLYRTMTLPQSLHPQGCCCLLLKCTWLCFLLLHPPAVLAYLLLLQKLLASSWCRSISSVISSASRHHHSGSSGRLRLEIGKGITKSDKSRSKKDQQQGGTATEDQAVTKQKGK